jgi:predicted enzyme related to lactoylglutathione lyase
MSLQCHCVFVTLASENHQQLVAFYQQLFEQTPSPYFPNRYAEFQLPGLRLGIFKPKPAHLSEFTHSVNSRISLCLALKNLDAAIEQFARLGYPPPAEIFTTSQGREIYAYDPDGNRLILYEDT